MSDATETKPDAPKPKLAINHGEPHPTADAVIKALLTHVSLNPSDPSKVLTWLSHVDIADVRIACLRCMTAPWSLANQPFVESLSDDQARALLVSIVIGFWQGMSKVK